MKHSLGPPEVLAIAIVIAAAACGASQTPTADEVKRASECAGARAFYDEAQTQLINAGACDQVDDVRDCVPHIALNKTRTKVLVTLGCPGEAE